MKMLLNWRYYVMLILGLIGIIGIFAIPNDDLGLGTWTVYLIGSKLVGATAFYINYKLTEYWQSKGLVPELSKLDTEE